MYFVSEFRAGNCVLFQIAGQLLEGYKQAHVIGGAVHQIPPWFTYWSVDMAYAI